VRLVQDAGLSAKALEQLAESRQKN
jgi:hypothetical protein